MQGKRSCRRHLAGHNERRRKPQPGSVLSSQSGRLSSALSENGTRSGSFILDFSAYSRLFQRDASPTARSSEWLLGNETYSMGRPIPHPWQISSQNPPSNFYLHGSAGGAGFPSSGIRPGECFTGVGNTDSSRALSLLSNHQWGAKSQASSVVHNLVNAQGASGNQSTAHHGAPVNQYPNPSWGYKGNEANSSSHDMGPDLVLGQISQPMNDQFSVELELSHHDTRLYMGLEHSRGYDSSTQHMHWSL